MITTLNNLVEDNREQLNHLESITGYRFRDLKMLQLALIHSSYAFERLTNGSHNETLEFLGDAVLDLAVGYILFKRFPRMREGQLTRIRSALVNESGLAAMARDIDLGRYLLLGKGEDASRGREKASILSCAYEALVGALFLDGGYEAALAFAQRFFDPLIADSHDRLMTADAKSTLQEYLQEHYNEGPTYILEKEEGPPHARIFTVSVRFRDKIFGTGRATSKKEAEQIAARTALKQLHPDQKPK